MSQLTKYDKIDEAEAILAGCPTVVCPLIHSFSPGLYVREILLPAGTLLTSKIHKTRHPFVIVRGRVSVYCDGEVEHLEAPYQGLTLPGTRRIIYVIEETVWRTVHDNPDNCTDVLEIERRLIEPHDNPLLSEEIKTKNYLNQKEAKCHSLESQQP